MLSVPLLVKTILYDLTIFKISVHCCNLVYCSAFNTRPDGGSKARRVRLALALNLRSSFFSRDILQVLLSERRLPSQAWLFRKLVLTHVVDVHAYLWQCAFVSAHATAVDFF